MKDQVTSIEQSKRLIDLGVPAEKASMVWEMDEDCASLKIWNMDEETRRVLHDKYPDYYYPAFTVVDLVDMMPPYLWIKNVTLPDWMYFHIPWDQITKFRFHIWKEEGGLFMAGYIPTEVGKLYCIGEGGDRLIDILCGRIEWLLSKGFKIIL